LGKFTHDDGESNLEIKAKLATVIEEAKANDPAVLKAEITRLKRELAAAAPKGGHMEALRKAEEAGYRRGYDQGVAAMLTVNEAMLEQATVAIARDLAVIADLAKRGPDMTGPNSAASILM
jgi:hypothetical protein